MSNFTEELKNILGPKRILSGPGERMLYSYDAALDKALPSAVALPESPEQVAEVVRLARRAGVPFVARGAGTNLCGGSVPAPGGLVIHLARLNRILDIDPVRRTAWVEPGVVNLHLQKALAPHGLFYAPDPASQKACTLGGNVGTNAGGPRCLRHGVTTNHVRALELVLPDGSMLNTSTDRFGYDLTGLFVGSEGTLGLVTKIQVRLLPAPEAVRTLLAAFPSMDAAAGAVTDIIASGVLPTMLEVMDRVTVEAVEDFIRAGYPRGAEAVLLIEVDGAPGAVAREAAQVRDVCLRRGAAEVREARDEAERQRLWEGRRGAYPAMARLAPNVLVEDGVVPRTRLPEALRRVREIARREGLRMGLIAHAGDGNLHPNMVFDERDAEETRRVKAAGYEMLKVCVELGGSISGEHGIGRDKREAMAWLFTPATLRLFRRIKRVFDPDDLCNPDKLIPLAPDEAPPPVATLPAGPVFVRDAAELPPLLRAVQEAGRRVFVRGAGTRGAAAPEGALLLDLAALDRVREHDRDNFTITVEAGARAGALRSRLEEQGQYLHLAGEGTVGGALSAGGQPALRDALIGLKAVLPGGDVVELGGKVMKNVAGYDALKLFIGAWGTLGVVVEATFRLFPFPSTPAVPMAPPPSPADRAWLADPVMDRVRGAFDPRRLMGPAS